MTSGMKVSEKVKGAMSRGKPLVALESTIITHGLPHPENLLASRMAEAAIQDCGAVPATVAVLDGAICVGLDEGMIERLANPGSKMAKISRADLAAALAAGASGSTTVSATMIAAKAAGIEVFATGGIGGVHFGAERSFDVSADLQELAQTRVTVVCAGPKAILDVPKTLEVLETLGVPVIGYQTDWLPAFWSSRSPWRVPIRMDDPERIALAHRHRETLGIPGGQLVANPIDPESEIPFERIEPVISSAVMEAGRLGVSGKEVTPFLLGRVSEATKGESARANLSLLLGNARLAAEIAVALKGLGI